MNPKQYYPSINGLRGISIFFVVFHHLVITNQQLYFLFLNPFTYFLMDGHLGVNIFFVISGFLITSLLLLEEAKAKTISIKRFFIRRTLRIFPAYYFLLFVYFLIHSFGYVHTKTDSWISAITYTTYFNLDLEWHLSHTWSLAVEEHFYILWPLCFAFGKKSRNYVIIFLILAVPGIRVSRHLAPMNWLHDLTIFTRIDAVATGCFFAIYNDAIMKK